ncbi:MAG: hypothetical protein Q7R91_02280 [bacterium]|nr:hypothetical protein [bacterium]
MKEWLINKKFIVILVALAVLFLAAFWGARFAASYYYEKGAGMFLQNNFEAAKSNFTTSLIFNSKNPKTHYFLGKIALGPPVPRQLVYHPRADYKEAVKHYDKAMLFGLEQKNQNLYKVALDDLGNAYWNLNELDKAREKYSEKLSKFPESSFWARYFIAWDDFYRLNKPEEALEILPTTLSITMSDNDRWNLFRIHVLLSRLNLYFGNYANAIKYAKLVIENVEPENKYEGIQAAHALLAVDYGRQKNFSLAEGEVKKANDLAGVIGAYNCSLAVAYISGENYLKAILIAEKTDKTALTYINSLCIQSLAISYLAKGDKINAKKYLEEYLNFTEKLSEKNIFVMRNRQQFSDELLKLK